MKLWGGRFNKATDKKVDDFNSSITFDARLYKQDILGSIAHATMLGKAGIIPEKDSELIVKTLKEILTDVENDKVTFMVDAEDIHMNIETILIERIGDVGKRLHTGRSRNDQVALDIRMYVKDEISAIKEMLVSLMSTILSMAKENLDTIMPGLAAYDFGDSIRFGASTAAEDETDLDKVSLNLEYFRAFTRGFLEACPSLTEAEVKALAQGAYTMTIECGIRFLTDYLMGDKYFSIDREKHNLDRCRTQFKLVRDMEQKWEQMEAIVQEEYEKLKAKC